METVKARPFLKWAGGKTQLLPQFENYYPDSLKAGKISKYIEPFIGSGAVFLQIVQTYAIEAAYLSDINQDLVLAYQVIKSQPNQLVQVLQALQTKYLEAPSEARKQIFLEIRRSFNQNKIGIEYGKISEAEIIHISQLIFLNRTCFNGLYRTNSKGEFNVPHGRYVKPRILDTENIHAVSRILQKAEIRFANFEDCYELADSSSFIYFDPPYRPISKTANFTQYSSGDFTDKEQIKLAKLYRRLDREKGAKLMLSNSDPKNENCEDNFFEDLYQGYNIHRVTASRMINSIASKRGQIFELLITN